MVNGVPVDVVNVVNELRFGQGGEQCGVIKRGRFPDVEPLVELEIVETEGERELKGLKTLFRRKPVDARVKGVSRL